MNPSSKGEETILVEALRLPPAERAAYVAQATAGNPELRQEVESLLQSHSAGDFLEKAAAPELRPTLPLTIPVTEKAGETIGRYKLLQQIGEGGCGVVYMAEQLEPVRRRVALKIIKLGMDTKSVIARFEAERQALALMDHANIAKVLDAGATGTGRPFFVMELVRGMKITQYCDEQKVSTRERLNLFLQVCQAIQHAHQKGIIHRDTKPSNILVSVDDGIPVVKVIDFGIAKATSGLRLTDRTLFTAFEQFIGTPAYMSPEQAMLTNVDVDTRSDIYTLGVLLYELLTGKTPFDAEELLAIGLDAMRRTIREQEPLRPSTRLSTLSDQELSTTAQRRDVHAPKLVTALRGDLDWIVMKALEKDRGRRYETANGLASDIQRHLNNEPVVACPPSNLYRLKKMVQRNKVVFAAGTAVAASLMIGLSLSMILFFRERHAREQANDERAKAREQAAIAKSVNDCLLEDLLHQADSGFQAEAKFTPDPHLTVREALERAVVRIGDRFKNQPLQEAAVRNAIGETLLGLGEAGRAMAHLERAFALRRAKLGPDDPDTLDSMSKQAIAYCQAGKFDLGLPLMEGTLKLRKANLGQHDRNTLSSMNNLALAYCKAGKLDLALPLQEAALKLRKANLGLHDRDTLSSMNDLASAYLEAGRIDQAVALQEEALKLRKGSNLSPDHPDTLNSMSGLATAYLAAGKMAQALPLYEEVVKLLEAKLGRDYPGTLNAMNDLANAYHRADKLDQALVLYEETLKFQTDRLGRGHPSTLITMNSLGVVYGKTDKLDQAMPLFEEALRLKMGRSGPDRVDTGSLMHNLMLAYSKAGKLSELEALLRDKLAEVRQLTPSDPSKLEGPVKVLVEALTGQGKLAEADQLLTEVLPSSVENQPASAGLLGVRGQLRARRGQWKEAAADLFRVSEVNPDDVGLRHELAALLVASGQLEVYREQCRKSIERFGQSYNLRTVERIAKGCLILPDAGVDLDIVARMAESTSAVTQHWLAPWFQLVNGLAEYRRGRFTNAVDWMKKTLTKTNEDPQRDVEACMVLAMAHHQLKQTDQAQAAFARGAEIERTLLPRLENGEVLGNWVDWIYAHALMREAKALIEGPSETEPAKK